MPVRLSQAHLGRLAPAVQTPAYTRADLTPGIVHIGVGNFHRAHMAVYMDRLMTRGEAQTWAILGAGIREADAGMRDKLIAQDCLTTVVDLDPEALSARVVGPMIGFIPVDPDAIYAALCDMRIRIVSLTVTEGGYYLDAATGALDVDHPDIQFDAANPHAPKTVFGLILKALVARRAADVPAFTVLSCDNLPGNGDVTRACVTALARLFDPGLADWVEAQVAFPNSMVDCITPATTAREIALVEDHFGIEDAAPVVCEPFRQWVIEDHFPTGRPPLEQVGVTFVDCVARHELMKLRILNAGHAALCYAAALLGHHFVQDAMSDRDLANWLKTLLSREAIPTLQPLSGTNYLTYLENVLTRFANPRIGDTIPRLAKDGSDRQPKFILPTLHDALRADGPIDGLALEIALWCQYCKGRDMAGQPLVLDDPRAQDLRSRAQDVRDMPSAFLTHHEVFGPLADNHRFATAFAHWLRRIETDGVRATLRAYVQM